MVRLLLCVIALVSLSGAATPTGSVSPDPFAQRLDEALTAAAEHDRFYGAALLARDGEVVLRKAYGPVDAAGTQAAPDTLFNIGSIGKLFTQSLILERVEDGLLSLDDTISDTVPRSELPNADKITIRQLLSHTSGYGDYFRHPEYSLEQRQIDDFLTLIRSSEPEFEPGGGFAYSNSAFWVLAKILEETDPANRGWRQQIEEDVFARAGMKNARAFQPDENQKSRPDGFVLRPNGKIEIVFEDARPGPDGGWYATVDDILAFDRGISNGLWYSSEAYEQSLRPITKFDVMDADAGLVWEIYDDGKRRLVTKGGTIVGGGAEYVRFREGGSDYTLILLSNLENAPLQMFRDLLAYGLSDPDARLPGPAPTVTIYRAAIDNSLPENAADYRQWASARGIAVNPMPMILAANQLRKEKQKEPALNLLNLALDLYPSDPMAQRLKAAVLGSK